MPNLHKHNCKCQKCDKSSSSESCEPLSIRKCYDCKHKHSPNSNCHHHNCHCNKYHDDEHKYSPKHSINCECHKCRRKHSKHHKHCKCHKCKQHAHNCKCHKCKPHKSCSSSSDHCEPDNCCEDNTCFSCTNRNYINHNNKIRCKLADLQYKKSACVPNQNAEEIKYKNYHYNGSFHKALAHNTTTGSLSHNIDYKNMVRGIIHNDQSLLSMVPLNPGAQMKLANPLASLSSVLIGAPPAAIYLVPPPTLSSASGAANMVENYSMEFARDIPFTVYGTDLNIALLLNSSHMNAPDVLANLLYKPPGTFNAKTLFRGISVGDLIGPYISQLMLLDVPMGGASMQQKYLSYVSRTSAVGRVEWGINNVETIAMENALIGSFPIVNPVDTAQTYIYNGRALAEAVHNDIAYQFYYQAAQILTKLGTPINPTFPVYPNQSSFVTNSSLTQVLCMLGEVTELALKHAWYWKWQMYRTLRPEVFGLWIDNVKNSLVSNTNNYDINNVVLNNGIMTDIFGIYNSYTLSQCYREGSPTHPAYPGGHAVCAGANCTILKIFYDGNIPWAALPGVIAGTLGPAGPIQANSTGTALISYVDIDSANMTVEGEINKLASNVSLGRDWAGVHYRTDGCAGILLGEEIAIKYVEDMLSASVENNVDGTAPAISFKKFDGTTYIIRPTLCK